MIDKGRGSPIVLIPGVQGRWQWMAPTIDALAEHHRVLSFTLGSYPFSTGAHRDTHLVEKGYDPFDTTLLDAVLDRAREPRVALVGVSFGGLIAVRYAAARPERVSALVLVSVPAPRMPLTFSSRAFLRFPRLAVPAFAARGVFRLAPELIAAPMTWRKRTAFGVEYIGRTLRWPISPTRMAELVRAWKIADADLEADCGRLTAPTLIITGEPHLDRVVPVASTVEYLTLIPGSRHRVLHRSGHIGLVSRPHDFATLVTEFVNVTAAHAAAVVTCT